MRITPAITKASGIIFREDFVSQKLVNDNSGAVVSGAPTFENSFTVNTSNADAILYNGTKNLLNYSQTMTIGLKWKQVNAADGNTLIARLDASTYQFRVYTTSSNVVIFIGTTAYVTFPVSANTTYDLRIVYDGTQTTANDRLKVWNMVTGSPVAVSLTYSGTMPTALVASGARLGIGCFEGTIAIAQGTIIYNAWINEYALSTQELQDDYDGKTYTNVDLKKASVFLPLCSSYVDSAGNRVTDNLGKLGGTALLGDGTTSSTFPTQITPHGMRFDGTADYLQMQNSLINISALSSWTIVMLQRERSWTTSKTLFAQVGPGAFKGIKIIQAVASPAIYWQSFSDAGQTAGISVPIDAGIGVIRTDAATHNGTTMRTYQNGIFGSEDASASFTPTANNLFIMSSNAGGFPAAVDLYAFVVYDFVLTPTQLRYVDAILKANLNV